jgi:hypothetical protein
MSTTTVPTAPPATSAASSRQASKRPGTPQLRPEGSSRSARQQAAAILEVLAGVRTPTEAAQQLAISLMRYYLLEGRALQGLVSACEPRPQGRVRSAASELAALRRETEQLRRQVARQQALLRLTQRTIGLTTAAPAPKPDSANPKKKRRPRQPKARALQAAAVLQPETTPTDVPADNGLSP